VYLRQHDSNYKCIPLQLMVLHCTYCSSKKNTDSKLLPAIERYDSNRIRNRFEKAKSINVSFAILSGKFGLIHPQKKIPFYDYLLLDKHVKNHEELVSKQLHEMGITDLFYFTQSVKSEPNIIPYLDCIRLACATNGIVLKIVEEMYYD